MLNGHVHKHTSLEKTKGAAEMDATKKRSPQTRFFVFLPKQAKQTARFTPAGRLMLPF
jgi:hypothetical protein